MKLHRGSNGSWINSDTQSWSDQKVINLAAFGGQPGRIWDSVVPITEGFKITIYVETLCL